MPDTPCPDTDALQRLALNQASPAEALTISKHLIRCRMCSDMVKALKEATNVLASMPAPAAGMPSAGWQASAHAMPVDQKPTLPHPPPQVDGVPRSGAGDRPVADVQDFLAPPQAPDEMGRMGPYRVLKILGTGGMGVVFQAEDPQLGRLVAIKAMRPTLIGDDACRKRFFKEARAAAAIDHEHIVTVYQVGEDRGFPYLAMQYLHGENLEERIWREKHLPIDEVIRIGREVAQGLSAAHEQGLIHRDIKPSNIWLEISRKLAGQPSNRGGRVKILDFGLARIAGDDSQHITNTGFVVGTAGYIAPEQARGLPVDSRCDLFSLGCVLYEMGTGVVPFQGSDAMSRLTALAVEQPRTPKQLNPDLPARFSELVMWLLNKAPDDRPRSAQQIVDALTELGNDGPPQSSTDSMTTSKRRVSIRPETAPSPQVHTPPAASPNNTNQTILLGLVCVIIGAIGYFVVRLLQP